MRKMLIEELFFMPDLLLLSSSVVSDSFVTPRTVARQAPLSMGFSRQEDWSGLSFPPPGDLPDPGIKLRSPALHVGVFTTEPPRLGSSPEGWTDNEDCVAYLWNLEKSYRGSYLQNRNRDTEIWTPRAKSTNWEVGIDIYTLLILYIK